MVLILLIIYEVIREGDFGYLRDIVPILPVIFYGGRLQNYGPEILYFAQLFYKEVYNDNLRNAILKGGLVRSVIAGSKYKPIDLMLEYQNRVYAINIKNNKNFIYDTKATLIRLALTSNLLSSGRKGIERLYGRPIKGTYTAGDPFTDIISYTFKLYNDGIIKRKLNPPTTATVIAIDRKDGKDKEVFDTLNIYFIGQ